MAKKKETHINNDDMRRMGEYLQSHSPPSDILVIWAQLQVINLYLQVALAASTRLRQLFLKAIRILPSSEKLRTRRKDQKDDVTQFEIRRLEKEAQKLDLNVRCSKRMANSL